MPLAASVKKTVSPLTSFKRASTSLGKMTPTEFPICDSFNVLIAFSAQVITVVILSRYSSDYKPCSKRLRRKAAPTQAPATAMLLATTGTVTPTDAPRRHHPHAHGAQGSQTLCHDQFEDACGTGRSNFLY